MVFVLIVALALLVALSARFGVDSRPDVHDPCDGWFGACRWLPGPRSGRPGNDGKRGESTEHEAVTMPPVQLIDCDAQPELGEPAQERSERELALHASEWRPQTVMDAVSKRQMARTFPVDVEHLGVRVLRRVPIGCGEADDDLRTGRNGRLAEVDRRDRVAERRVRHRGVVAQQLFYRDGELRRIGPERGELFGLPQQRDHAVADEARGRVVTGDDQLEDRRQQLLRAESLLAVTGSDQAR